MSESAGVILSNLEVRNLLDFTFESHVGFLEVLDVLMLHLVHVDGFQDLVVLGKDVAWRMGNSVHLCKSWEREVIVVDSTVDDFLSNPVLVSHVSP